MPTHYDNDDYGYSPMNASAAQERAARREARRSASANQATGSHFAPVSAETVSAAGDAAPLRDAGDVSWGQPSSPYAAPRAREAYRSAGSRDAGVSATTGAASAYESPYDRTQTAARRRSQGSAGAERTAPAIPRQFLVLAAVAAIALVAALAMGIASCAGGQSRQGADGTADGSAGIAATAADGASVQGLTGTDVVGDQGETAATGAAGASADGSAADGASSASGDDTGAGNGEGDGTASGAATGTDAVAAGLAGDAALAGSTATLTEPAVEDPASVALEDQPWNLILVNATHPIPEGYTVGELQELRNDQSVDKRIYPELQQMFDDCRAAGLDPYINSSYRSHQTQVSIMEERVESYMWDGYSEEEARALAESEVAIPGTSEHELGLALDIMSERESYEGNDEVRTWLAANGYRYGFILRYPEEKTGVTGIVGEPWHFRYVGVEAATAMHESGQCLEEYLGAA